MKLNTSIGLMLLIAQLLVLVPEFALAIGFTGGNYGDYRTWSAWKDKLLSKYVIEAVVN